MQKPDSGSPAGPPPAGPPLVPPRPSSRSAEIPAAPSSRSGTPLEVAHATIVASAPQSLDGLTQPVDPKVRETADFIARAMGGRDPEQSIDIAPPSVVAPPEERPADSKDPYIGTTFDHRYKIQKLLGEGGMGFVYLARHKVIDKKVAVKVLRADMAKDREILDRFLQEAKSASSIGNPHIIDISDFGDLPDGSTYFVMEYLEGQSLGQIVESGERMAVDRICNICIQIADGLSAAHARGIVHRDLKPDNVFVVPRGSDQDFVKILDFGIAKVTGNANTKLTKAGAVFGTPHYMSPEQAAGAPIDHRADIYALGVMLYEMVSGQLPFNADNFMGILTQHMYKAPVPIRALVPGPECPPSLEAVILKCLSKKPEARYQSMDELGADIERIRSGGVPHAVAEMMARSGGFNVPHDYFKSPAAIVPGMPPTSQKKLSRYVALAGALAAVGIVVTIFVVSNTSNGNPVSPTASVTAGGAAPSAAPTVPVVASSPSSPASASAAPAKKMFEVAVSASPDTAQLYRDGRDPETLPAIVKVEEGKPVDIEIRADGFDTQKVTLDGSEKGKSFKLIPTKGAKPLGKGPGPKVGGPRPKGPKGSEVVDPWK